MTAFPKYKKMISLVPGGTLQFLDLGFNVNTLPKIREEFWEYPTTQDDGRVVWHVRALVRDDEGYVDRQTLKTATDPRTDQAGVPGSGKRIVEAAYAINAEKAIEPFLDEWVPLPFLRAAQRSNSGDPEFKNGPTNWCRARITALGDHDRSGNTHALTIVFDPHVETEEPDEYYAALTQSDVNEGGEFALVSDVLHNAWFLKREWVSDWIKELYLASVSRRRNRPVKEEDLDNKVEHLSRYLTFLTVLRESGIVPRVRLVDPRRFRPVEVDLVLDIGNSRTCGMLIERAENEIPNMSNGTVLELRDLSNPTQRYREPFGSNVAFGRVRFGDPNDWSLMSYRMTEAFVWPSVVRVGPEARRIALKSRREEGQTSMSSPKRYLWDREPRPQEWRYCPDAADDAVEAPEEPVTTGPFVLYVNNQGTPVDALDDPRIDRHFRGQGADPVTSPVFSRSSMMMFLLSEIIAQALVQINAPAQRGDRRNSDIPRQLRRIILTMPTAMPIAERKIFKQWADWAVETVWRALDWGAHLDEPTVDFRNRPEVRCEWDEASTTQLVWLYNETAERFAGNITDYFRFRGSVRKSCGERPSLRVASIDIGGGTTDLIITTYLDESTGATGVIRPRQEFREGFNLAGDDILKAVIENHVLTGLLASLEAAGVRQAREFLSRRLGKDHNDQTEHERNLRAQFADQVAVPFALHILRLSEKTPLKEAATDPCVVRYADVFGDPATEPNPAVLQFIEEEAMHLGGAGFRLANLELEIDLAQVAATIGSTIGPMLFDLCELVHKYDCDVLLLSGRPSCLPAVQAVVLAKAPVAAGGFVPLSSYKVGHWYPFWTPGGLIADPKTSVAVGAVLCALAEGSLQNFHFKTTHLRPASTCRFVGQMEQTGQIRNANLFFSELDLDSNAEEEILATLQFSAPIYIGFRQLALERWKATPFYYLNFANQQAIRNAQKQGLPYKVTLAYRRKFDDSGRDEGMLGDVSDEGAFGISEVVAADGSSVRPADLHLQLKTMKEDIGHWLDTGLLEVR